MILFFFWQTKLLDVSEVLLSLFGVLLLVQKSITNCSNDFGGFFSNDPYGHQRCHWESGIKRQESHHKAWDSYFQKGTNRGTLRSHHIKTTHLLSKRAFAARRVLPNSCDWRRRGGSKGREMPPLPTANQLNGPQSLVLYKSWTSCPMGLYSQSL